MRDAGARVLALAVAALLLALALGALEPEFAGSARLVACASVAALLAPFAWPGAGRSFGSTAARIVAWTTLVVLTALVLAMPPVAAAGPVAVRAAQAAAVLWLGVASTLVFAATVELLLTRGGRRGAAAVEGSRWAALAALVVLSAAPLALGPAAERAERTSPGTVDALLAGSPLVHVASAAGNDLLRNQWFYRYSNLASLRTEYPSPRSVVAGCTTVLALLLAGLAWLQARARPHDDPYSPAVPEEPSR
jgi:hypothetical protein